MTSPDELRLSRDCAATELPSGQPVVLAAGTPVRITQSLGGNHTVAWSGGLAQIGGTDADALGRPAEGPAAASAPADGPVNEERVWEQLRHCFDPEIPVTIVDLGLIYDCRLSPHADGGQRVDIKMTLTAPGCGMGEYIKADIENRLRSVPGVTEASVELVWDPPWNQELMSESAKLELGLM